MMRFLAILVAFCTPFAAYAHYSGPPTLIATVGMVHLHRMDVKATPEVMAPLLDKLAAWKPDVITHESIPGEQCEALDRDAAFYPGQFEPYCWGTAEAQKATGLTVAQALAAIETTFATWPAVPSAAQRRQLAALFLAANDRQSAQVQWRRLPPKERRIGDGIDDVLLTILTRTGAAQNESYEIAVALAVRLGLDRIYAVDDHSANNARNPSGSDYDEALQPIWTQKPFPEIVEMDTRERAMRTGKDLLNYVRFINRPAVFKTLRKAQFGTALNLPGPRFKGRQYAAWWEVRNLRMAANVRAASANHPAARVLNIVGAAHKPYYDAYLAQMGDVRVVDVARVLR